MVKYTKKYIIIMCISFFICLSLIILTKENTTSINYATNNIKILANGIEVETFPSKQEGFIYEGITCASGTTGSWDESSWTLTINTDKADGCIVYFKKKLIFDFNYTGDYQIFTAPETGTYTIELWGAQGGSTVTYQNYRGLGGYVSGNIELNKGDILYVYVGQSGIGNIGAGTSTGTSHGTATYNGGGKGTGYSGGGATDVRLTEGSWEETSSLASRIIVASGGGGTNNHDPYLAYGYGSGHAGGLTGYFGPTANQYMPEPTGKGATQTAGGANGTPYTSGGLSGTSGTFGIAGNGSTGGQGGSAGGGGGGYYGGGGAASTGLNGAGAGGGGGSSYISGHTGSVAITSSSSITPKSGCITGTTSNDCSIHYSELYFTDTIIIDGSGYNWTNTIGSLTQMPSPDEDYYPSGIGHRGDGFARITYLD